MQSNRTALVTGSSRGIGAATARRLATDNWDVVINYNASEAAALALAEELHARAIKASVSSPAQVEKLFQQTGPVDLLVCSAGISLYGLFTDTSEEDWQKVFSVNADGAYRCCRAAIPAMVHRKAGNIILISSVWGVCGASCEAAYSASKAALIGLTKSLAKELGPSNIRVNCVAPGVIDTNMMACFSDEDRKILEEETPLGRLGTPEDVAELIAFLASDRASFITGQIIECDGGFNI